MTSPDIFAITGSALTAQDARMGAIAANLANVDSVAPPGATPYHAHELVFEAAPAAGPDAAPAGVQIAGTVESNAPVKQIYDPGNPLADSSGYVTGSNVSQVNEMVDLIDSSNSYAASVAVLQQASRIDQQMLASFQV